MAGVPPVLPVSATEPPTAPPVHPGEVPGSGWVWVLTSTLFVLYVSLNAFAYFSPGPPTLSGATASLRDALRLQVLISVLPETLAGSGYDRAPTATPKPDFSEKIEDVEELREGKLATEDQRAAWRLVLLAQKYAGDGPSRQTIETLEDSADPRDNALAASFLGTLEAKPKSPPADGSFEEKLAWAMTGHAKPYAEAKVTPVVGASAGPRILFATAAALVVLGLGAVLLVALGVGLATKAIRPVGYRERMPKSSADSLALKVAIYLVGFVALGILLSMMGTALKIPSTVTQLATMAATLLALPVILKLPLYGFSHPFRSVLGDVSQPVKKALTGVGVWLAIVPIEIGLTLLASMAFKGLPAPSHEIVDQLRSANGTLTWLLLGVVAVVFAPVIEETMFRGALFPALKGRIGKPVLAALVCGLTFALIHPQGPILWPALAMVGMAAALVTYYTGSLMPAMALHACQNLAALVANWLINS